MDNNRITAEQMEILKEYVRFKDGNTKSPWTCTKCSHESTGRPNRIVAHLLGITGKGIRPCPGMKETSEREDLARRLGRNSQSEQIVIPVEDTHSPGFLFDGLNDGVQDNEQSPQLDSSQPFTPQGGMGMDAGDPQVNSDQMNDQYMHPSQDGVIIDTATPGNAFGVGMAREPGFANPPPCPPNYTVTSACQQAHTNIFTNTQEANAGAQAHVEGRQNGIRWNMFGAGSCQPQTSSNTREANTGFQASEEGGRENGIGQNLFGAGSCQLQTSRNTREANAGVEAPEEGGRDNGIGQNMFGAGSCQPQASSNTLEANASVQAPGAEGRENSIGQNMFGAGSCQPQASTHSTLPRFASDTTQPINDQDVSTAPLTNLDEIEAELKEVVREHFRTTWASGADQQQRHESTSSSQNQLCTDLVPSAPSQVRSSMRSSGNYDLFDSGPSQGTEDFASLAARFRELSQTEVDARRQLVQNMLKLVRKLKTLTSEQADLKMQLEETESVTVKKRKEVVHNWLQRVDKVKEEVVHEINDAFLSFRWSHIRFPLRPNPFETGIPVPPPISPLMQQKFSEAMTSLNDLKRKNNRIEDLITEVDELLEEGKSLLDLTVDAVLQRKVIKCWSHLQHFVEQHFKTNLGNGIESNVASEMLIN